MIDEPSVGTVILDGVRAVPVSGHRRPCVVIIAGGGVGEVFRIDRALTVGRGDEVDVRVDDAGVSRRHARFAIDAGGVAVEDLQSVNGRYRRGLSAPDVRVGLPRMASADEALYRAKRGGRNRVDPQATA